MHDLEAHSKTAWAVSFNPSGKFIASGSLDCTIAITDTQILTKNPA